MPYLSSEPSKANPWESVRYVLYVFWLIQFWICGLLAVTGVAGLFETPFDYRSVLWYQKENHKIDHVIVTSCVWSVS